MSVAPKSSKNDKQLAASRAILEVIEKDGLLGVTHSKVARKAGISRAWIYEYIGRDKSALIEFAAEVFASHFARAKAELPKSREELELRLREGVDFLLDSAELSPLIIKLYFRFRGTANPVGQVIKKYEKHWLTSATKTLVTVLGMADEQASLLAELILTLRMGFAYRLATAQKPGEARQRAQAIFAHLHSLLSHTL